MRSAFIPIALFALVVCGSGAVRHTPRKPASHARTASKVSAEAAEDASAEPLRPGATGSRVMRAQILLDRARFSPGEIDARYGDDLGVAVKGFQRAHAMEPTGAIGPAVWQLLNEDSRPLTTEYTISEQDVQGPFEAIPAEVQKQAGMKAMPYASAQELLGEKFHASPRLLAELNPGKTLTTAGEKITVPDVSRSPAMQARKVVVSAAARTVVAYDLKGNLLAQYPATIGGEHDPLPLGHWTIAVIEHNPRFFFDPAHLWNADQNEAKAVLPPGPNNPVGTVWMGLTKRHYGIHGTPDPGHIRHGESNGCIRLTNWDAEDLAHMVRRGTPAILEE